MSTPQVDWASVTTTNTATSAHASGSVAAAAAPAAALPDMPRVIGRMPIVGRPSRVILELPQPYRGVGCGAVFHNVTLLSDCTPVVNACRPHSLAARPLDDRRIEVELADGDGTTISGPGWDDGGFGGQLDTRWVPVGVPVVEVDVVTGRTIKCGPCDPANHAVDPYT